MRAATRSPTLRPTAVEPVNETSATRGSVASFLNDGALVLGARRWEERGGGREVVQDDPHLREQSPTTDESEAPDAPGAPAAAGADHEGAE